MITETRFTADPVVQAPPASTPTQTPRIDNVDLAGAPSQLGRFLRHMNPFAWAILDWLLVGLATYIAYRIMVFGNPAFNWVISPWPSILSFGICITIGGMIFGLYERSTMLARSRILARTALTLALGSALAYAIIYVAFYSVSSRWIGMTVVLTHLAIGTPLRLLAHTKISQSRLNVLCLGTAASVRKMVSLLQNGQRGHFHIVGHVLVQGDPVNAQSMSRFVPMSGIESGLFNHLCPCVGSVDEMPEIVKARNIEQVIVDPALASHPSVGNSVLSCLETGCRVTDQPTFTEKLLGEVPADAIGTDWFVMSDVATTGPYDAVKRIIDITAGIVGLALTLPFFPLLWLAVRLDSPGNVLYKQIRVGLHGRHFNIYKVRTMRQDAERNGAQWATVGDSRVTRLGKFLRKTRIDEMPQFWNILKGDMSIVGPRPERPEFVEQLTKQIPHYRQRHLIKPGLTGWAQINYRYGASIEDTHRKLCYDLYYLKHRSFDLDAAIIIRTAGTFVSGAR